MCHCGQLHLHTPHTHTVTLRRADPGHHTGWLWYCRYHGGNTGFTPPYALLRLQFGLPALTPADTTLDGVVTYRCGVVPGRLRTRVLYDYSGPPLQTTRHHVLLHTDVRCHTTPHGLSAGRGHTRTTTVVVTNHTRTTTGWLQRLPHGGNLTAPFTVPDTPFLRGYVLVWTCHHHMTASYRTTFPHLPYPERRGRCSVVFPRLDIATWWR